MSNRRKDYRDMERYRITCAKQNKRYYDRNNYGDGTKRRWTIDEIDAINRRDMPDVELAREIRRSVKAIQVMRAKMKRREIE